MQGDEKEVNLENGSENRSGESFDKPPIAPMEMPDVVAPPEDKVNDTKDGKTEVVVDNAGLIPELKIPEIKPVESIAPTKSRNNNWIWWAAGVFGLLLVAGTIYYIFSQVSFNRAVVAFSFNPGEVDLVVDDESQGRVSSISVRVKAGDHTVKASKEGYLIWEEDFVLLPGEEAEFNIELKPIPTADILVDVSAEYMELIRKDELIAYFDKESGSLKAYNLLTDEINTLFNDGYSFPDLKKVSWSPSGVAAIVKLPKVKSLRNMFDNSNAKGMFIPLGGSPEQAPTLSNGIFTWLFDNTRLGTKGFQPIFMNENIRDVDFSSGGNQVMYFYEAANGEKSLVRAESIDGSEWVRVEVDISAKNPSIIWMNDDRYVLLFDDGVHGDRVYDIYNREFTDIMPNRVSNTPVLGSPDGSKILYTTQGSVGPRVSVWNLHDNTAIEAFQDEVTAYVWQSDEVAIVSRLDGTLWYWRVGEGTRPIQFISSVGKIIPTKLLYSNLNKKLYLYDGARLINFEVD